MLISSHNNLSLQAVFFDWDGTIADSREGIFNSVRYAVREAGIPGLPERSEEDLEYFIGPPLYDGFEHVYGVNPEQAALLTDTYRVYYRDRGIYECVAYGGIADILRSLRAAGVKTAVVSSKPQEFLDILVDHLGLSDCFDAVFGPDMTNHNSDKSVLVRRALDTLGIAPLSGAQPASPTQQPSLVQHHSSEQQPNSAQQPSSAQQLIPPQQPASYPAAMVGDRKFDMEGAKAAGVTAIGVLYGYGSEPELTSAGADVICPTVEDLQKFFHLD